MFLTNSAISIELHTAGSYEVIGGARSPEVELWSLAARVNCESLQCCFQLLFGNILPLFTVTFLDTLNCRMLYLLAFIRYYRGRPNLHCCQRIEK